MVNPDISRDPNFDPLSSPAFLPKVPDEFTREQVVAARDKVLALVSLDSDLFKEQLPIVCDDITQRLGGKRAAETVEYLLYALGKMGDEPRINATLDVVHELREEYSESQRYLAETGLHLIDETERNRAPLHETYNRLLLACLENTHDFKVIRELTDRLKSLEGTHSRFLTSVVLVSVNSELAAETFAEVIRDKGVPPITQTYITNVFEDEKYISQGLLTKVQACLCEPPKKDSRPRGVSGFLANLYHEETIALNMSFIFEK